MLPWTLGLHSAQGPQEALQFQNYCSKRSQFICLAQMEAREKSLDFSPKIALNVALSQSLGAMVTKPSNMSLDTTNREKPETLANSIYPQGWFICFGNNAHGNDDFLQCGCFSLSEWKGLKSTKNESWIKAWAGSKQEGHEACSLRTRNSTLDSHIQKNKLAQRV